MVTLTGDGRQYERGTWCSCSRVADDGWVQFQIWTLRGMEAHGFLHATCRRLLQTG